MSNVQLTDLLKAFLNAHIILLNKAAREEDWDTYWDDYEYLLNAKTILFFAGLEIQYNYHGKEIELL